MCCVFFFFQAEDGIRDIGVTGVQTCALPICQAERSRPGGVLLAEGSDDAAARKDALRAGPAGGGANPGGGGGGGCGKGRGGQEEEENRTMAHQLCPSQICSKYRLRSQSVTAAS